MKKTSNLIINKKIELVKGFFNDDFQIDEYYLFDDLNSNMNFEEIIQFIRDNSNKSKLIKEKLNIILNIDDFEIDYLDSEFELEYEDIFKKANLNDEVDNFINRIIYRGFNFYKKLHEYMIIKIDKAKVDYLNKAISDNKYKGNLLSIKNYCDYLILNNILDDESYNLNELNIAIVNVQYGTVTFTIVRNNRLYSLKEFNINFTNIYDKNIDNLEGIIEDPNFNESFNLLCQYLNLENKLFETENGDIINLFVLYGNITNTPGFKTALSKNISTKVVDLSELDSNLKGILNKDISMTSLGAILYG